MAFKFIALFGLLAVASAGLAPIQQLHTTYQHAAPVYAAQHVQPALIKTIAQPTYVKQVQYEHEAPAEYDFSYSVHDEHTGDIKSQHETRHGDSVQGQYSLLDSDGHQRIVDYTADAHNGFNAVVRREPTGKIIAQQTKIIAQPALIKTIAQPAVYAHAQPAHYSAVPVAHVQPAHHYSALPVAHVQPAHYSAVPVAHVQPAHYSAVPVAHASLSHYAAPQLIHSNNHHHY